VIDRVNLLTQIGCVTRDLEHDQVCATQLAHGLIDLVQAIIEQAGSPDKDA
jgi:hypothetical protein